MRVSRDLKARFCYPVQQEDSLIQNYESKENNTSKKNSDDKRNKIFLPYIPKVSDLLKRQLSKEGLHVIFLKGRTIGQWLCNNKPKGIPKRWKQKVYKIPCKCGRFYIGETGVWFDEREDQHKAAVKRKDITNSLAAHIAQTGHSIKWDEFTFIDGHKYQKNRKIKESLYINAFSNCGDASGQLLNLEAGTYVDKTWNALNPLIRKFALTNSYHPT